MMRSSRRLLTFGIVTLAVAGTLPAAGAAHEGHTHKFMGTITLVHHMENERHVMIDTTDGKSVTVTVNEETEILRGKTKVSADELKEGIRVVAEATTDQPPIVAKVIRLGETASSAGAAQR